jgi:hypothetical protein
LFCEDAVRLSLDCHSAGGLIGNIPGGAERQLALLAKPLASRGNHATRAVPDHYGKEGRFDGVELRLGLDDVRGVSLAGPTVVSAARWVDGVSPIALRGARDGFADSGRYQSGVGSAPSVLCARWSR